MLISLEWLNEYVDIDGLKPEQIAHELTMSGLEVEEIEKISAKFTNIVVAKILEINQHPNADKLHLVKVFNGTEEKTVVCGAQNIEEGQIIPYASVGSQVLDRKTGEMFTLKPAKIRDVESQGMLCSADELGVSELNLQEEDGILILNRFKTDLKEGQDVKDVLNIKEDVVLHTAPTANRGDEMSVIGVAREVAAIFNRKLKTPELISPEKKETDFNLFISAEDACKYYSLGVLKNVKIKPSPDWMSRRLIASGVRSINNVVDITNYVMLEYGQPLHAFDLNKMQSKTIVVRRANENEKLTTLDDVERSLNNDSIVIATENEPVALAGVMGGFSSEVEDTTTSIALESAYFTPPTNRRSSRSVGIRTESCARFERGVDIGQVKPALLRAIQLMQELADAELEGISETGNDSLPDLNITLRFEQIKRILGCEIPGERCIQILENLGFELDGKNQIAAKFKVPSFRINDVTREIDLIEEVSRINGIDKIAPTLPSNTQAAEVSFESKTLKKIHNLFLGNGFNEIVTSSLIGNPLYKWAGISYEDEKAVKVSNPQTEEHTMLRQSLMPNLLNVIKYNFDKGEKNLWVYEVGKTFFYKGQANYQSSGVEEKRILIGAITGNINAQKWQGGQEPDFYSIKGVVESLFKELNIENRIEFEAVSDVSYLHPGRCAKINLLGKGNPVIGFVGQVHPQTLQKCKISQPVYTFEVDLECLLSNLKESTTRYKQLPLYPSVQRDTAFIISKEISNQQIIKVIKKSASKLFVGCEIFDVYEGQNIPEGCKNLAYRITLQDADATLTDEKVDNEMLKIKEGLKKAFNDINFRE